MSAKRVVVAPPKYGTNCKAISEGRVELEKADLTDDSYAAHYYHSVYDVYVDGEKVGRVYSETRQLSNTYAGTVIRYDYAPSVKWSWEGLSFREGPYPGFHRDTRVEALENMLQAVTL